MFFHPVIYHHFKCKAWDHTSMLCIIILFKLYTANNAINSNSPIMDGLIVFLVLVFIVVFTYLNIKKRSKKYFESNKLIQSEQKYIFSDDYFEVINQNGQGKIMWDKVNRIEFFKSCYAIFISENQACIIPKRCIEGAIDKDAFESMLSSKVSKNKTGK